MAQCIVTGKSWMNANRVSHSNIKTKRKVKANIQSKRVFDVESGRFIRVKLSTRAIRMLNKMSLSKLVNKFC